jgi:hypothetical protein
MPALLLSCLALGATANSCALQAPPAASGLQPAPPVETAPAAPFVEAPEMTFVTTGQPLPDGPISSLVGFYGQYGSPVLTTCRIEQNRLPCSRYPVEMTAPRPQIVEIAGRIDTGKLDVDSWQPFAWDEASSQAAARKHLEQLAPALAVYDWSRIARADFAESSRRYHPGEAELKALPLELTGYDTAGNRIIWRAQGPAMPQQKPLVTRYPALYILTDPAGEMPGKMVVTIEGFAEE